MKDETSQWVSAHIQENVPKLNLKYTNVGLITYTGARITILQKLKLKVKYGHIYVSLA